MLFPACAFIHLVLFVLTFFRVSTACLLAVLSQLYRYYILNNFQITSILCLNKVHDVPAFKMLQTRLDFLGIAWIRYCKPLVSDVQVKFIYLLLFQLLFKQFSLLYLIQILKSDLLTYIMGNSFFVSYTHMKVIQGC